MAAHRLRSAHQPPLRTHNGLAAAVRHDWCSPERNFSSGLLASSEQTVSHANSDEGLHDSERQASSAAPGTRTATPENKSADVLPYGLRVRLRHNGSILIRPGAGACG